MEVNKIELKLNEDTIIELPSRETAGLRIVFTISDPTIVSVTRKEITPIDVDKLNVRPGDAIPAIWTILGLKTGITYISFSERKPGVNDGNDIPLKKFEILVN